ncbi:hypothetical protein BGZ83_004846 [Gryganskiella cystojenkinii]|nr:hypothetical protein BGZ83_004846 [Gryganskiella cystojenkinii]
MVMNMTAVIHSPDKPAPTGQDTAQNKPSSAGSASVLDTSNSYGLHDTMRFGMRQIASEVTAKHPLENRLAEWDNTQLELKMSMARNMYGMHAPIKMAMERSLVTKARGISMLPQKSRNLGEEILLGRDESIDFEDFLNTPELSTDMVDVHAVMEHKLGLHFLGDRHFWVKSAVVNVLDSQLVEIGCSQLRRLHLKQRFSWYEWPYDEYSEEGGESSAQEEEEDEEDEEDDEFESTVDEMAVEGQGIHLGRAENALALIGLNTQLQSLTLDWDLNLRPHLTKNALDRFMEAPSLADFDLRIRHHGTLTDVILFCSHCPLSIMKLNISYCGNNAIIFDDEVQFQEDVVRKPFRSLPLLEDLSITGQITEMEDRFVFPFLGSSCPNLKRITIPDVETIEFKMPEDLSLEGDSDVLVENLFLMAESLGLGWEQTFYSFFVALMLRFAPKLEEYDLNAQLSEQELYRLASRPLLVQDSSTLPSPHHEPYRRIKAISWWIGPEMNRRVIPTLLHNFGTTLETIKLLLNDFRPDLRYLDPNWNPSVLDPSLLLLENNNVDGVQRLVPVSEIAEHTKQVLRNCPNLRILVVSHKVQTPRYHLHGQQPIIPRTGISLHDLVNVEWACSKTIRSLTLDIWDPPPRPKTGDVGQDRDDRGHEDEIKDINDEDDEDGVFQPYISEADYLSCFSYNRRSLLLNAHGNARVDALTAAEAAAFAVKEARQKSKKLSVQTVPLSELGRENEEEDEYSVFKSRNQRKRATMSKIKNRA